MRALALPLVLILLAGCIGGDAVPDARRFSAAGGSVSPGWAYDGSGVTAGAASIDGQLSDGGNSGIVNVSFTFGGEPWVVTFGTFAEAAGKPFMDGGVEFELDEHGDSGVADTSIPKIHAVIAAWGGAQVTRSGVLAAPTPWSAHLMLSSDTVRGADGKITKADGATPYDPSTAADARRVEGDPQAIFWIKHPQGETFTRPPTNVSTGFLCQAPQCGSTNELEVEADAVQLEGVTLHVSGPSTPVGVGPVGRGRIAIVDASGTELAGADIAPAPQGGVDIPMGSIPLAGVAFPLSAVLAGEGAFTVVLDMVAVYDDVPFLVITWNEYTVGSV